MTENKYQNTSQIEQLEKAIADMEAASTPPVNPVAQTPPKETTFEKRYADLRSFSAKRENDLKTQLEDAKRQLAEATSNKMKFPKTEEELTDWAAKYPDVYDMIVTIAKKNAIEVNKDVDTRLTAQIEREKIYTKQKAYDELCTAHPDFPTLVKSEEFVSWLDAQPLYIYNALYENETDAHEAIRAVDLYKADMNLKPAPKKNNDTRDAARTVPNGSASAPNGGNEVLWTESKVAKLTWREQDKHLEEIEKAMSNPAFYDLSGAAR